MSLASEKTRSASHDRFAGLGVHVGPVMRLSEDVARSGGAFLR